MPADDSTPSPAPKPGGMTDSEYFAYCARVDLLMEAMAELAARLPGLWAKDEAHVQALSRHLESEITELRYNNPELAERWAAKAAEVFADYRAGGGGVPLDQP